MRTTFPIMNSILMNNVPWDFIAPHEAQAMRNHGQTLSRLAERGGLNAAEALAVVEGLPYGTYPKRDDAAFPLINKVREWLAAQRSSSLVVGGRYNWKGQPERLAYLGRKLYPNGYWHQFEKVDRPGVVWCEVRDSDLSSFEETKP